MAFAAAERETTVQMSDIACRSCRKRKIKCERKLPACKACIESGVVCQYPDEALKPGPKVGSSQRRARRSKGRLQYGQTTVGAGHAYTASVSETGDVTRHVHYETDNDQTSAELLPDDNASPGARPSNVEVLPRENVNGRRRGSSRLNIHDFSFILHPSHEASRPEDGQDAATDGAATTLEHHNVRREACQSLGMAEESLVRMTEIFFDNMVALTIFHEPSFQESLKKIKSATQMTALLGAMMGYAVRFLSIENDSLLEADVLGGGRSAESYLNLATRCVDEALSECDNEAPPLCVLQALTIATHCRLSQGVRRKAWRSLGLCVRLAYELDLHLLDSRHGFTRRADDIQGCVLDEEKRRVWWIIWEMDVFASTIRRTPTAMNWTQMEVLLPVHDNDWFQNRPSKSCFFEQDLTRRWRTLQESGNQSGKAWFIVINSFMMEARIISCPRPPRSGCHGPAEPPLDYNEESRQQLEALSNSVQCLSRALPDQLRFQQQYLNFEGRSLGTFWSARHLHCSIYQIYLMIQLTQLMIFRYDVFGGLAPSRANSGKRNFTAFQDKESSALSQYFEAADNILNVVKRSCETHYRYINPFLTSTIWLAAAVQLLHKTFGPSAQTALITSRFDVLDLVYKQSVHFWGLQTAMQENLEWLKSRLEDGGLITPAEASTDQDSQGRPRRTDHTHDRNVRNKTRFDPSGLTGGLDLSTSSAAFSQAPACANHPSSIQQRDVPSLFARPPLAIATQEHPCSQTVETATSNTITHGLLDSTATGLFSVGYHNFPRTDASRPPPSSTIDAGWTDFDMSGDFYDLFTGLDRYQTPFAQHEFGL